MFDLRPSRWASIASLAPLALAASIAHAESCGPAPRGDWGPLDYRVAPKQKLSIVESFHFNNDVETLRKGQSSFRIGEDLEFVLHYFPNHTRALNAMVRLGKRDRTDRPPGNKDTIDCWFDRAIAFRPDDGAVRLLHALWLVNRGDRAGAMRELDVARESAPEQNGNYMYNLGLAYLEVGEYEQALAAAHRAYGLGYPLPGLRERLQKLGKWRAAPAASNGAVEPGTASSDASPTAQAGAATTR